MLSYRSTVGVWICVNTKLIVVNAELKLCQQLLVESQGRSRLSFSLTVFHSKQQGESGLIGAQHGALEDSSCGRVPTSVKVLDL